MSTAGIRRLVVGKIVSHKNQVKTDSKLRGLRAATPQTFGKLLSDYLLRNLSKYKSAWAMSSYKRSG